MVHQSALALSTCEFHSQGIFFSILIDSHPINELLFFEAIHSFAKWKVNLCIVIIIIGKWLRIISQPTCWLPCRLTIDRQLLISWHIGVVFLMCPWHVGRHFDWHISGIAFIAVTHYHNNNEQLFWKERSETNKKEKLEKCRLTERKATINHLCLKILVHSCGLQILWSPKPLSVSPTSRLHSEKYIQTCTVCSSSYPLKDHCYRKFQHFLSWFSEDEMEVWALSASRGYHHSPHLNPPPCLRTSEPQQVSVLVIFLIPCLNRWVWLAPT